MQVIEVQSLEYQYPGSKAKVIRNMSFSVSTGEIFGFLGPSGAGKSTTQKILIGILEGYQGEVTVLGRKWLQFPGSFANRSGWPLSFPTSTPNLPG